MSTQPQQASNRITWPPEAMTVEELDAIRGWAERHRNDYQAEPIAAIALQGVLPRLVYEVTALRTAYTLLADQLAGLAERAETAEAERDELRRTIALAYGYVKGSDDDDHL